MKVKIAKEWQQLLQEEFDKPYFSDLVNFIKNEYNTHTVYPKGKDIFRAFEYFSPNSTKVVIIGQDPYHNDKQAHGLAFSVPEGIPIPPSLRNIFKELHSDLDKDIPISGNLTHWAKQGVLLLNATLTVRAGKAGSHQNKGWETFTDAVIKKLSETQDKLVFLLWGAYAQRKGAVIDSNKHHILKTVHPSPLSASRGFFGSKHFSKTNKFLSKNGQKKIYW